MFVFCVVGIDLRLEFEGKVKCGMALAGVGCCLASLDGHDLDDCGRCLSAMTQTCLCYFCSPAGIGFPISLQYSCRI